MANASREEYQELDVLIVPSPILNAEGDAFLDIDPDTGMFTGGHLRLCAAAEFPHGGGLAASLWLEGSTRNMGPE